MIDLISSLKSDGVNTDYIKKVGHVSTGIAAIIVEHSGNNAITVVPGANYSMNEENIEEVRSIITDSRILMAQLEIPLPVVKKALSIAKRSGVLTILNPAPATVLDQELLSLVDILTPNELELELLSGCPSGSMAEIQIAGNKMLDKGVNELIVTLGEKGCAWINRKE